MRDRNFDIASPSSTAVRARAIVGQMTLAMIGSRAAEAFSAPAAPDFNDPKRDQFFVYAYLGSLQSDPIALIGED
jgi:hypothetical protein